MTHCILVFESTHQVLKAEKALQQAGIRHEIIPTPKDLSSDCGMSIRVYRSASATADIAETFAEHHIAFNLYERATP
jgi:hypothetical protein